MTAFAVMEDDTILCADCVHEIDDREPVTAGTFVYAWLAAGSGQSCRWCAAIDDGIGAQEGGS